MDGGSAHSKRSSYTG